MNPNVTQALGLKWEFNSIGTINNVTFSTGSSATATTASSTVSSTAATSLASASSTSTSSAVKTQDTGLSTGAKIAIGVAVPLGVLLLAALCFVFLIGSRKRRRASPANYTRPEEMDTTSASYDSKAEKLSKQDINPDETHASPSELQDRTPVFREELE